MDMNYPVVLLCGGKGTRLEGNANSLPKCLVEVGGKPIIWHIMNHYSSYGYKNFIICLGHKSHIIKDYFLKFNYINNDIKIEFKNKKVEVLKKDFDEDDWNIILVETGEETMTGGRIKQIAKYINTDTFFMTYGDGVSDVDISKLLTFHQHHEGKATLTGVHPRSQFGQLEINGDLITAFKEKALLKDQYINGGYFVLSKNVLTSIPDDMNCVWEKEPLENLVFENELYVYRHEGFWHSMDTLKDKESLDSIMSRKVGKEISYV